MSEFVTDTGVIYYEVIEAQEPERDQPETLTLLHNFMSSAHAAWGPLLPELAWRFAASALPVQRANAALPDAAA